MEIIKLDKKTYRILDLHVRFPVIVVSAKTQEQAIEKAEQFIETVLSQKQDNL